MGIDTKEREEEGISYFISTAPRLCAPVSAGLVVAGDSAYWGVAVTVRGRKDKKDIEKKACGDNEILQSTDEWRLLWLKTDRPESNRFNRWKIIVNRSWWTTRRKISEPKPDRLSDMGAVIRDKQVYCNG